MESIHVWIRQYVDRQLLEWQNIPLSYSSLEKPMKIVTV